MNEWVTLAVACCCPVHRWHIVGVRSRYDAQCYDSRPDPDSGALKNRGLRLIVCSELKPPPFIIYFGLGAHRIDWIFCLASGTFECSHPYTAILEYLQSTILKTTRAGIVLRFTEKPIDHGTA